MRISKGDSGSTHVLEAVIIATIMVSAVAFVATFEAPPPGQTPARGQLKQQAEDALAILAETPVYNSDFGDNLMSVYLAHCMQGDCSQLTSKLDRLMPEGSSYALYLSNGYETFPVFVTKSPPGEAVSARRLLEPHWSYTFTSTGSANVNNYTDSVVTYALPVFNSNVIQPGGSPLKVTVTGTKKSDGSNYTLEAFYSTLAVGPGQAYPAASLNFLTQKTAYETLRGTTLAQPVPGAFWDRTSEAIWLNETLDPVTQELVVADNSNGFPTMAALPFTIRLQEHAGVTLPANVNLTLEIPRGWNASATSDATWDVVTPQTDWNASYNGSIINARLKTPLNGGAVDFNFHATYHGDILNYYPFRAFLGTGAEAEANLIVKADAWPQDTQTFATPSVKLSVPRPMGSTATTTWSLAVNVPYNEASSSWFVSKRGFVTFGELPVNTNVKGRSMGESNTANSDIEIKNITIVEQDGAKIFDTVTPGSLAEGKWTAAGDRLYWDGSHSTTLGPLNLTFNVKGSGVAGKLTPRASITPPVLFDSFKGKLVEQISPGLYRTSFLPNNTTGEQYTMNWQGYDPGVSQLEALLEHNYSSDSIYRATLLEGKSNYTVNPISPFRDGLYGSYVNVDKRSVPIGGQVVLTADVQSILYALSQTGSSAGVNLTFYPPWTGNSHKPIWWQDNLDSGIVTSDVMQIAMLDVNADGYADPIIGTNQGRVFALHALTGERLQGNAWVAPLVEGATAGASVINQLATVTLNAETYIVVGTDAQSNLYVLDDSFTPVWSWTKSAGVVGLDLQDFDGDDEPEILVSLTDNTVSVLKAVQGQAGLVALDAGNSPIPGAFYQGSGTAGKVWGMNSVGANGNPAVAISMLNKPGANVAVRMTAENGLQLSESPPQIYTSAPRAGVDVVDSTGTVAWQFLAGPTNVAKAYDYGGDTTTDLLVGTSSGFVSLMNGLKGGSPMAGGLLIPAQKIVDADSHDLTHGAIVSDDGGVYFTLDKWNTVWCVNCDPAYAFSHVDNRLTGIALNNSVSMWAVGTLGAAYRSISDPSPLHQPLMAPVTVTPTKGGVPLSLATLGVNLYDVHFRYGAKPIGDEGWIVGSPAQSVCILPPPISGSCAESTVLHTTDGGASWQSFSSFDDTLNGPGGAGTEVTSTLRHISFTTDQYGWIVGDDGALLNSSDAGLSWWTVPTGTTDDILAISCLPDSGDLTCIVSTSGGKLLKLTHALTTREWSDITTQISPDWTKPILDVAIATSTHWYAVSENAVIGSWDGGQSWSTFPLSYVPVGFTRLNVFSDNTGYVWGGTDSEGFFGSISAYMPNAVFQTADLLDGFALPPDAVVVGVTVTTESSTVPKGTVDVSVSTDGNTWYGAKASAGARSVTQNDVSVDVPTDEYLGYVSAPEDRGRNAFVRVVMGTPSDSPHTTSMLSRELSYAISYRDPASSVNNTTVVTTSLTGLDIKMNGAVTTAVWDSALGELRQPFAAKYWTRNVSGEVNDIQTGYDLTLDGREEVWVGTGDTLAENTPEYQLYAGANPDTVVNGDNRVYLLDGGTGRILQKTDSLPAPIKQIRLADETGDGTPDFVFVMTYDSVSASKLGQIFAFDPATLEPKPGIVPSMDWMRSLGSGEPMDMEVGQTPDGPTIIAGTRATTGTTTISGQIAGFRGENAKQIWYKLADERGHYVVKKDIPRSWFYGPYVVEIRVEWTDAVDVEEEGVTVVKEVLQSARFYDYFLVTPPDALSPPSPVYDVHLVTWFDDWR